MGGPATVYDLAQWAVLIFLLVRVGKLDRSTTRGGGE
jgi:hypothetical protein